MRIRDVHWRAYSLPFRDRFSTSRGVLRRREGIIVEIATDQGITGIGEIAPLLEFGGGGVGDALAILPHVAVAMRGKTVERALEASYPDLIACGVEMALLDALGKERGQTAGALLASARAQPRASVRVNAVVGARDADKAVEGARQATRAGFRCIKLKVGMERGVEREIARVARVRAAIGDDIALRLDANEAWDAATARAILSQCARFAIQYVEQPLPRHDLDGLRNLREAVDIPIAADEALSDLESARALLAGHAADVFVIKPQIVGGLRAARRLIDEAAAGGVRCMISSAIESGVGLAAALHLVSATPAITLECGLATARLLEDDLIVEELPIVNGAMSVPRGPGLGVTIDEEAMHRYGYRGEQ